MGILSLILGNKNLIMGVILIALLGGGYAYIKILKGELSNAVAEKNVLTQELGVSQASVKNLMSSINDQNAAIDKMKADTTARIASHQVELTKAKSTADQYRKQAQYLMNRPAPQSIPKCDAANDLINEEIKNAN